MTTSFKRTITSIAALVFVGVQQLFAAKTVDASGLLSTTETQITGIGTMLTNVVSALIGIIGIVMLAWNFYKRAKGDQQSNDALMGWGSALLFAALGLQIIKFAFF